MDEVVPVQMGLDEARRVTERIRLVATNVRDGIEKLKTLLDEAQAGGAWSVLGYKSWTAYLADVMGDEPLRLSRDERREVVQTLAASGMSTRAIAPIVGTGHTTVSRDLEPSVPNGTDRPEPVTRVVHSMDGIDRTYPRNPGKPRRQPLTDTFNSVLLAIEAKTRTLHQLTTDTRWRANKNQVATMYGSDLERTINLLQEVNSQLEN